MLTGENLENYRPIRNFTLMLGSITTGLLTLVAFTPLATIWFQGISGLSMTLTDFALTGTQLMVLLPSMSVLISFQRGILVTCGKTAPISIATAIEVGVIIGIMLLAIGGLDIIGVFAAAGSVVVGRLCANFYLGWRMKANMKLKKL